MDKWIKNDSGSDQTWVGQLISNGAYYQIQSHEEIQWTNNNNLLIAIANGDAIVAKDNTGNNDISDFNEGLNYLKNIDNTPTDSDGAPLSRAKVAPSGWTYQMKNFEFETCKENSIVEINQDGLSPGYTSIKFFKDIAGSLVECTDQTDINTNCIQTEVYWMPDYDYEVIGGAIRQLARPANGKDLRLWVVAVPDIPENLGGSKTFINGINMAFIDPSDTVNANGRVAKKMIYDATYKTNKFKFIMRHEAGLQHRMMVSVEYFIA